MVPDLRSLGIDRLTVSERLQLIGDIWDSIPEPLVAENLPTWYQEVVMDRLNTAKDDEWLTFEQVMQRDE